MYKVLKNKIKEVRNYRILRRSGLFDCDYYLRNNLDVARSCMNPIKHYLRHGWREGRNPCECFDNQWYLETYPDVAGADINPLYHFLKNGFSEGRSFEKNQLLKSVLKEEVTGRTDESPLAAVKSSQEVFFSRCKSLVLVIDHNLGGGANHYRDQLINSLIADSQDVLLLHNILSHGKEQGYKVSLFSGEEIKKIEYTQTESLFSFFDSLSIRKVIYNSLVYYDDLEKFLMKFVQWSKSGIEVAIAIHDFFPVCPSFNLVGQNEVFCGLQSINQCPSCLNTLQLEHIKNPVDILHYKRLWHDVLDLATEIVCFSQSSVELLEKAYPLINKRKFRLRPHSMDYFCFSRLELREKGNGYLKIAVVGDIYSVAKGTRFVSRFSEYLLNQGSDARIFVLGKYDGHHKNVVHLGVYKPHELSDLMTKHDIDIAFIPSVWPETFSYLTSELIMIGMPLVCFDFGAQAEKVREYELGAVISEVSAEKAMEAIDELCRKVYGKVI